MQIIEALCTGNSRYKAGERLTPKGVVLHSIGTPQPDARVLRSFWDRNGSQYVVHYMVDDRRILRCMPDDRKCWHVGTPGNDRYLGVEMGEPKEITYVSGAGFTVGDLEKARSYVNSCYKNAVWLLAKLCRQYGWDPFTAVYTHREITRARLSRTDHVDPQHLWDGLGLGIDLLRLRRDVAAELGSASPAPADEHPTLSRGSSGEAVVRMQQLLIRAGYNFSPWGADGIFGDYTDSIVRAFQAKSGLSADGICGRLTWAALEAAGAAAGKTGRLVRITAQSGLNVRSGPGTGYSVVKTLAYGGAYTIVEEQDGWGLLKAYADRRNGWVYLAYTEEVK